MIKHHLLNTAELKPLTGHIELAIKELGASVRSPQLSVELLLTVVQRIGGRQVNRAGIQALSAVDRSFLLRELLICLTGSQQWLPFSSPQCHQSHDIAIDLSALNLSEGEPRPPQHAKHSLKSLKSPALESAVSVSCPNCTANSELKINWLEQVFAADNPILEQVHTLARPYHWSEAEILGLPRHRRQQYLALIHSALDKKPP